MGARDLRERHGRAISLNHLMSEEHVTPRLGGERKMKVRALLCPQFSSISKISDEPTDALGSFSRLQSQS